VETVETGWNTLVDCDPERIVQAALEARKGQKIAQPYGDSWAGEQIIKPISRPRGRVEQ